MKPSPVSNDNLNADFIKLVINHLWFNVVKTETNTNETNVNKAKMAQTKTCDNNRDLHL